jgi:hypothetical protein
MRREARKPLARMLIMAYDGAMKQPTGPKPITLTPEIVAKCDGPDQGETFDRGVRAFLAVPKNALPPGPFGKRKAPRGNEETDLTSPATQRVRLAASSRLIDPQSCD